MDREPMTGDRVHSKRKGARERAPNARDDYEPHRSRFLPMRLLQIASEEVSELHPKTRFAQGLANGFPQFSFNKVRTAILRAGKLKIGKGSLVMGELYISGQGDWPSLFSVGENTFITGPLRVNLGGAVRIGSNVNIGHNVMILAVDHQIGPPWRRAGWSEHAEIAINDGAWIGSGAVILPGVEIGAGAVIAAGAVVAADVPPNTLVGGVPARPLKSLNEHTAGAPESRPPGLG